MGSAVLLAVTLVFILSGCLEGNRNYGRYQDQGNYSGIIDSSAWYVGGEKSNFIQPLGYPKNGDFSGNVKRSYVTTEEELVAAIENQSEPLIVVIANDIALTKTLVVKLPLLIQTTTEFGFPNSSLQFLASSGGLDAGGAIVADAPSRKIQNLNCDSKIDKAVEEQTFLKIQGKITNPKLVLKSNTHFVADIKSDVLTKIKISSQDSRSTIVLLGDNEVDLSASVGRLVISDRSGTNKIFEEFRSEYSDAKIRVLYLGSYFRTEYEGMTELRDFPESYLGAGNQCMDSYMFQQVLSRYRAKYSGTSSYTIEKLGNDHKTNCEAAGWGAEVRQRRSCAAETTPKDAAKVEGGAL